MVEHSLQGNGMRGIRFGFWLPSFTTETCTPSFGQYGAGEYLARLLLRAPYYNFSIIYPKPCSNYYLDPPTTLYTPNTQY